jgi:hypothetical protein
MRKVLRAKLRHQAETTKGKTIKLFRFYWKQIRVKQNKSVSQPVVEKSML